MPRCFVISKYQNTMKKLFLLVSILSVTTMWASSSNPSLRAYNKDDGGFVILNEDDQIIGFSDEGKITDQLKSRLSFLGQDIEIVSDPSDINLVGVQFPAPVKDSVGPLLGEIKYNQGKPYNYMTPTIPQNSNNHCVTGCVATAMAMVASYWQWPKTCLDGSITYTPGNVGYPVTYTYTGHSFDWENIKPAYTGILSDSGDNIETKAQQDAIADLMVACGVGVRMGYGLGSSGSQSENVPDVFLKYFNYKNTMELVRLEDYNIVDKQTGINRLYTVLINEFDAGRPIYCSGYDNTKGENDADAFHAYVIDGYVTLQGDNKLTMPFFHFNFGWGGGMNGWYMITGTENRSIYTSLQMIINLEPNDGTGLMNVAEEIKDGKIRDILGREVRETIPGQLYILDGKKYIAR